MTGGEANMSGEVGAEVSAWDGYISGRNLELIPGERIVQSWRTTEFADEHEDSVISIVLTEVGDGTLLTLEHSNVPDDKRSYEEGGWQSHYFEPMVTYFTGLRGAMPAEPRKKSAQQSTPKAPPKRPTKTAVKTKPAAKAKSQRAASPAKAAKKKIKNKAKKRRPAPKSRKKAAPKAHKTARRKRR